MAPRFLFIQKWVFFVWRGYPSDLKAALALARGLAGTRMGSALAARPTETPTFTVYRRILCIINHTSALHSSQAPHMIGGRVLLVHH
jgi:hypothetical protein